MQSLTSPTFLHLKLKAERKVQQSAEEQAGGGHEEDFHPAWSQTGAQLSLIDIQRVGGGHASQSSLRSGLSSSQLVHAAYYSKESVMWTHI